MRSWICTAWMNCRPMGTRRRECGYRPPDTSHSLDSVGPTPTPGGTMRIRIAPALRIGVSCLVGLLAAFPSLSRAQTTVRGVVVDSSGKPVNEVTLGIIAIHVATRTDDQ